MSLYIVCLKWEIIWIFCILFARTGQVDLASIVVHELGIESGQASHVMFCCFYRSSQTWRGEQQTKTVRWCPSPLCCYWGAPPLYATMLELDAGLQLSTRTHWNCCWGAFYKQLQWTRQHWYEYEQWCRVWTTMYSMNNDVQYEQWCTVWTMMYTLKQLHKGTASPLTLSSLELFWIMGETWTIEFMASGCYC